MRDDDGVECGAQLTDLGGGLYMLGVSDDGGDRSAGYAALSAAEWQVVRLALRGLSNRAISRERRATLRTIANQLAAAYQKLNVRGRRELRARHARLSLRRNEAL